MCFVHSCCCFSCIHMQMPSLDMEDPRVTAASMELCARLVRDFDRQEREAENRM